MAKKTKEEEAPKDVNGATSSLPETLTVTLDTARWWVPEGETRHTVYGPGTVEIPYAMAEGLVRAKQLPADVLPVPLAEQPVAPVVQGNQGGGHSDKVLELVESLANRLEVMETAIRGLPDSIAAMVLEQLAAAEQPTNQEGN